EISGWRRREQETGGKVRTRVDGTRPRTWCGWPRDAPQRESDQTRTKRRLAASPSGTDRDASRCGTSNGRIARRKNGALNQSRRLVARLGDFRRNGGSGILAATRKGLGTTRLGGLFRRGIENAAAAARAHAAL